MGGGYNIRDFDGERTEFGKLSDWKYNGQSAVQVIGMLSVCSATGNMICAEEYDRIVAHWTTPLSMGLYGGVWKTLFSTLLGPHNGFYKPNDTIHATCAILMHHLTSERKALQQDRNRKLLVKLSAMSGRDRNPFFNYVLELMERQDPQNLVDALLTLRMFPDDKRQISALTEEDTKEIQPISNLRINSHYWKTRWYERRERTEGSARTNVEYSGQDYLGVYWMGRFYGFISDEEANQPISW